MNDRLIGINELAETLDVPISWIYARTRLKGPDAIPHLKLGKYVKFNLAEVMDWVRIQSEAQ